MGTIAFISIATMFLLKMPIMPDNSHRHRIETIHVRKTKSNIDIKSNIEANHHLRSNIDKKSNIEANQPLKSNIESNIAH